MNIKITKTINLNDVPSEIRSMISSAKSELDAGLQEQMLQIVRHSLHNTAEEFFGTIDQVEQLRERLTQFDETLQEISNIMLGYKDIIIPNKKEQQRETLGSDIEQTAPASEEQFGDLDDEYMEKVRDLYSKNQEFLKSNGYEVSENEAAEHEKRASREDRAEEGFDEEG
jgi:hypothetical protein